MMLTDALTPEFALALGFAAFILFLCLYAIGRLFSRTPSAARDRAQDIRSAAGADARPSYTDIAAAQSQGFLARGDEPVFTPAPDYANASMEIPHNASYTQVAVATAAALQRGLKPKTAAVASAPARTASKESAAAAPLLSYAAIASQTVGEPRLNGEAAPGPQRVDYSTVDIDLSGLESYAAVAVAAARGQAAQAKTLH